MLARRAIAGVSAAGLVLSSAAAFAQTGSVKVTAARANVRAAADEKSAILGQATLGTVLVLDGIEGDWFHVEVMVGGVRVAAYLSKKVATVVAAPEAAAPAAPATPPAPPPPPDPIHDGMSVTLQTKGAASSLFAEKAIVRRIAAKVDTVRAGADLLQTDVKDADADGSVPMTFLWTVAGASADRALDDHRPTLVVTFKEVPGYSPDGIAPALVRLSPTPSGTRLVALVRGTADETAHSTADWDVLKDIKQDTVKASIVTPEPGAAQIIPSSDLVPGEYAIVFRPTSKKKLSGLSVLRRGPELPLFSDVWTFSVK